MSTTTSTSLTSKPPPAGAGKGRFTDTLRHFRLHWCPVVLSSGPVGRGWDPFVDFIVEFDDDGDVGRGRGEGTGARAATTARKTARTSHSDVTPGKHAAELAGQLDAALALARTRRTGGGGEKTSSCQRHLPGEGAYEEDLFSTPEFGPWPYQRAPLPNGKERSKMPSVEELNDWAAEVVREIFADVVTAAAAAERETGSI